MKKYKVLRIIGDIISGISATAFLFIMCMDLEMSPDHAILVMIAGMAISGAGMVIGQLIANLDYIQGICIGATAVMYAWLHTVVKRPSKVMKRCYRLYQKEGTYSNTFYKCRELYDDYLRESHDRRKKVEVENE